MNHLGSTMLVYGTQGIASTDAADLGGAKAAYDYRAFGEQVSMMEPAEKVTENFTGKELDDEIELNYFGARYLDPMLGLWISVDPKRQFASPYLYVGNGANPIVAIDPDGNKVVAATKQDQKLYAQYTKNLTPDQAERLSVVERDENFIMVFHAVDGLIPVPSQYDPNKGQVAKGTVETKPEYNIVLALVCFTCEDSQEVFAHEVVGHGRQIRDFLNGGAITGKRSLDDVSPWVNKNTMELEKDAFEVQGAPKTDQELENMGY